MYPYSRKKNYKKRFLIVIVVIIFLPILFLVFTRLEGEKPEVSLNLTSSYLGVSKDLIVKITDKKSGVRNIRIILSGNGKEVELLQEHVDGGDFFLGGGRREVDFKTKIEPKKLGLAEGEAIFRIEVRDLSWRGWFHGNKTTIEKKMTIDFKPPVVTVLSRAHNITQGGSGLVIYELSEECPVSGVQVGDQFFPGYSGLVEKETVFAAFFALAFSQDTATQIFIRAVDLAGNTTRAGFPKYLKKKRFKSDKIKITDRFLQSKMPEFDIADDNLGDSKTDNPLLAKFLIINNRVRRENTARIMEITSHTEPAILWKGKFLRLANSKRMAGFAEHRTYLYQGKKIDEQTHLGIDLAAYSRDKVTAANRGKVVFADDLGIYGQTVILDHGFGLFSMYSHLSRIDVQVDQMVIKDEPIGLTGKTGMAGGDHLHFSIVVHNTFVNPVEWWDAMWIKNNITSKIKDVEAARP